jgi:hypothetical protein
MIISLPKIGPPTCPTWCLHRNRTADVHPISGGTYVHASSPYSVMSSGDGRLSTFLVSIHRVDTLDGVGSARVRLTCHGEVAAMLPRHAAQLGRALLVAASRALG